MDIKMHFSDSGVGLPLILLHGNGESHNYFKKQIEFFKDKYRVIAPDTRGHGLSRRGVKPFTIEQFAEDLNDFMLEHAIERAIILGFSDGANIALEFAFRHPEKVIKLVLNGANLFPRGLKNHIRLTMAITYHFAKLIKSCNRRFFTKYELLKLMVKEPNISFEAIESFRFPTLVIVGTKDMIKRKHSQQIAKHIEKAYYIEIQGDHFIAKKKSDEFNDVVDKFLKMDYSI